MADEQVTKENKKISYFIYFKEHYAIFATTCTLIFSVFCFIFGVIYFSYFEINHFLFSGLADIYLTPLSQGLIPAIFMSSIIAGTSIFLTGFVIKTRNFVYVGTERRKNLHGFGLFCVRMKKYFSHFIIGFTYFVFAGAWWYLLFLTPIDAAEAIKEGFTVRYIM
jgi:hypothetical protein